MPVFQSECVELMLFFLLLFAYRSNMKGKRKKMESELELINNTFWICCSRLLRNISIIILRTWWTSRNSRWYVRARAAPVVGIRRGSCVMNTLTCTCASVGFHLNTQKRVFDFHFSVSVDIPYGTRFRCAV